MHMNRICLALNRLLMFSVELNEESLTLTHVEWFVGPTASSCFKFDEVILVFVF